MVQGHVNSFGVNVMAAFAVKIDTMHIYLFRILETRFQFLQHKIMMQEKMAE